MFIAVNYEHISHLFLVFVADFELVNVGWIDIQRRHTVEVPQLPRFYKSFYIWGEKKLLS